MVIGPDSLAERVVEESHELGELLVVQLLHRLDQLRYRLKRRIMENRRPAAACLVEILGRVKKPVDPIGEPPQDCQLGQVLQHPLQVVLFRLA